MAAARRPKRISQDVRDLASCKKDTHTRYKIMLRSRTGLNSSSSPAAVYLGLLQVTVHGLGHVSSMDRVMVRVVIVVILLDQN